jgi:hypothetical protein
MIKGRYIEGLRNQLCCIELAILKTQDKAIRSVFSNFTPILYLFSSIASDQTTSPRVNRVCSVLGIKSQIFKGVPTDNPSSALKPIPLALASVV